MSAAPRSVFLGPPIGPPPFFQISPSAVNFGNAPANTPTNITVTLTYIDPSNTRPGSWFGVSLTNTQFTLTNVPGLPITFRSGQSATFQITFNQPLGTYSAACDIATNVGVYVLQVTAGSGTGGLSVVPPALYFPGSIVGQTSAPQSVQIFNNSPSIVHISAPTFSNADFAFAPTPPTFPVTLAPGANVSLFVTATPSQIGPNTGNLTLTSDLTGFNPVTIPLTVVAVLFNEGNALQGTSTSFLMGFGHVSEVRQIEPGNIDSELSQTLTFNGPLWGAVSSEKVVRRLQFYYENVGVCTLSAVARVQRYDPSGNVFTDSQTSTVTFGTPAADGLEYSAFFDFQIAGEIVYVDIKRGTNAGPCSLFMFVPSIEDSGEKVESV